MPPVCVLELDPDLGEGIPPAQLERARRACRAETLEVRQREWDPEAAWQLHRDSRRPES